MEFRIRSAMDAASEEAARFNRWLRDGPAALKYPARRVHPCGILVRAVA